MQGYLPTIVRLFCEAHGSVTLPGKCLDVGSLRICGNTMTHANGTDVYTFTGNVNINKVLLFTDKAVFTGDPETGKGKLTTPGEIYVSIPNTKIARGGKVTILTGAISPFPFPWTEHWEVLNTMGNFFRMPLSLISSSILD